MDIKRILSLPKDERDDEIRKLIVPKPWEHDWYYIRPCNSIEDEVSQIWGCKKCGKQLMMLCLSTTIPNRELHKQSPNCPIPDPIALDWNLAMKMRDEIVEKDVNEWNYAKRKVYMALIEKGLVPVLECGCCCPPVWDWWDNFAESTHYILAALKAKENHGH
jgi:hypothetical protein